MRKIFFVSFLVACVLFVSLGVAFPLGESRIGRVEKGKTLDSSLPGRLSRGTLLPPVGSSGNSGNVSGLTLGGSGGRVTDTNTGTQAPSNTQTGINAPSEIPINLGLNLNLFGLSIDGQEILQGNSLTSTQLVLLSQNASADLVALNIATVVQNNFQIGINVNFSPMITVVFVDNSWTVVTETPSLPAELEGGGNV